MAAAAILKKGIGEGKRNGKVEWRWGGEVR